MRFLKETLFYFVLIFPLLFISCKRDMIIFNDGNESSNVRSIRIKNSSQHDFRNVILKPGNDEKNFGDLRKGETSGYDNFDEAYNDMMITVLINNIQFHHVPGNPSLIEQLNPGKYTIQISVLNYNQRQLSFFIVED